MRRPKVFGQLHTASLLIALLALLLLGAFAFHSFRQSHEQQTRADLAEGSRSAEQRLWSAWSGGDRAVRSAVVEMGRYSDIRLTVLEPPGRVVADSAADPAEMDNEADRPEVRQALAEGEGHARRVSHVLHQEMQFLARRVRTPDGQAMLLRTGKPLEEINAAQRRIGIRLIGAGLILTGLAALATWFFSRRISVPLWQMQQSAQRFARGKLEDRIHLPPLKELRGLAHGLNEMAAQLRDRIDALVLQRNEMEAILSSMVEGVIAVDDQERLLSFNPAAGRLLGIEGPQSLHRTVQETIRHAPLQRFIAQALAGDRTPEGEIVLRGESERILQAHGTPLRDASGRRIGALIVLNDVTRLKRLEGMRRDFAANVSHELRTPITSIKGFVETLLDGAVDHPADARRFLEIVGKQADRLGAIIDDLLSLSHIEKEGEAGDIPLEEGRVRTALQMAVQDCRPQAEGKNIAIQLECPDGLTARFNSLLLVQAVANLIDNAVKYSDEGREVRVTGAEEDGEVVLRVIDKGVGIEEKHLGRLFERFYRVDKARSRKVGGTGLGLAIVKHIAQAHDGRVTVESRPGEGSTFSIRLPSVR